MRVNGFDICEITFLTIYISISCTSVDILFLKFETISIISFSHTFGKNIERSLPEIMWH